MDRRIFREEHDLFRRSFRAWIEAEFLPHRDDWEAQGIVPREVWRSAGEKGFLCPWLPESYGGADADFLYSVVICEELERVRGSGLAFSLHSDIVVPYIATYGSDEQKGRYLPGCVRGEWITCVAMTEPGAGSDLAGMKTTARRDGNDYVLSGQKTFITNGALGNLCLVAAKTGDGTAAARESLSLFLVEEGSKGFSKGPLLQKMGLHSSNTVELFFEECRVPAANRLGSEGAGFRCLMEKLQQERLIVAIKCQTRAEKALSLTLAYCKERKAFGKPIAAFQNTQFRLAEMATEVEIGRHFLDRLIEDHTAGKSVVRETCMSKYWHSEMVKRVVDQCVQLYGGYGYMMESEICKAYLDARAYAIFAGTNEIMKIIVAKQLGL